MLFFFEKKVYIVTLNIYHDLMNRNNCESPEVYVLDVFPETPFLNGSLQNWDLDPEQTW